jgi:hypothetical protein
MTVVAASVSQQYVGWRLKISPYPLKYEYRYTKEGRKEERRRRHVEGGEDRGVWGKGSEEGE